MSSSFEHNGVVQSISVPETGVSKAGKEWQKQEFVVLADGEYEKPIAFTLFGDKCDLINGISVGDFVAVKFNLESREYNGKWFHNVNAWSVVGQQTKNKQSAPQQQPEPEDDGDGLPF